MKAYLIALGANLPSTVGPPAETLRQSIEILAESGATDIRTSRFFATPCFPPGTGPDYVNAAASLRFGGTPGELLDRLHSAERHFGRARARRWGQRTLDLDLIAADDRVLPDRATFRTWCELPLAEQTQRAPDELILPHPRLQDRAFVLVPLAEVAPEWRHPVLGLTVAEMLARLPDAARAEIRPV